MRKKLHRNKHNPSAEGKLNGKVLTHMRNVAFNEARIEATNTMRHAERLRDDEGMLAAAEEKRKRKMLKRLQNGS